MPLKKCKREDKKSVEHLQGIFTTYTALRRASMFLGGCGLVRGGQKKECGDEIIVTHTQVCFLKQIRFTSGLGYNTQLILFQIEILFHVF